MKDRHIYVEIEREKNLRDERVGEIVSYRGRVGGYSSSISVVNLHALI